MGAMFIHSSWYLLSTKAQYWTTEEVWALNPGFKFMASSSALIYASICLFPVAQMVKNLPAMQETQVQSLGWEDPLEKGLEIHSSILAWRIPWADETGGLYSSWGRKELDTTELLSFSLFIPGSFVNPCTYLFQHSCMHCSQDNWFTQPLILATWCEELTHGERP